MHAGPRMPVLSVSRFNSTAVCTIIKLHQPMLSLPCTVYRHTPQLTFVEMNTMWLCLSTVACIHDTLACMVVHGKAHGGVCMAACASQWRPHICIAISLIPSLSTISIHLINPRHMIELNRLDLVQGWPARSFTWLLRVHAAAFD